MCERWRQDFTAFLSDVGRRPDGHTLDRINVNGNYEPGNVRWATGKEQAANRRPRIKNRERDTLLFRIAELEAQVSALTADVPLSR